MVLAGRCSLWLLLALAVARSGCRWLWLLLALAALSLPPPRAQVVGYLSEWAHLPFTMPLEVWTVRVQVSAPLQLHPACSYYTALQLPGEIAYSCIVRRLPILPTAAAPPRFRPPPSRSATAARTAAEAPMLWRSTDSG